MMVKFSGEVYNSLTEIDQVIIRQEYDRAIIPKFGEIIKRCGWEENITISLVHRHFNLFTFEKMIADFDMQICEWKSMPKIIDENKLIPCSWKINFDIENNRWALFPLDFLIDSDKFTIEKEIVKKLFEDFTFLEELANAITKENAQNVFGISLLMSRFNDSSSSDMVMFEENDKTSRISHSYFIPRNSLDNPNHVTQWHFRNDDSYLPGPGTLKWCDHL
jgi:hypothetical protein